MASSTVLRVKRRLDENPQDALVLVCKRKKTESDTVISPSLFVFCGTVDNQENNYVNSVLPRNETKLKSAPEVGDIINKLRKERKDQSSENRYEIVNCSRGLKDDNIESHDNVFDLVDLQLKKTSEEDDVKYAYDVYTAAKKDFDISMLDDLVSIEKYESELIFGSYRDNGRQTPSSSGNEESDDSNDENNWRNDYPDSENSSIDEEAMIKAVERCDIEDDLSSDAGEEDIYEKPPDIFNDDAILYGPAYAKYKAKVLSEESDLSKGRNLIQCAVHEIDEESLDGYKDDSDEGFYYGQEEDTDQFRDQYNDDDSDFMDPD